MKLSHMQGRYAFRAGLGILVILGLIIWDKVSYDKQMSPEQQIKESLQK